MSSYAALIDNAYHKKVWPLEGILIFVDYLLQNWNFRKVYAETPEFSASQFASGAGTYFEEEGRLRQHQYFQGRYWDYITYTLTRERWETHGKAALKCFSEMQCEWQAVVANPSFPMYSNALPNN